MSKYWVASHITGIFTIEDKNPDPLQQGSLGAGFSISRGTTTWIENSDDKKTHFYFNGKEVVADQANITNYVLKQCLSHKSTTSELDIPLSIFHEFEVPLSCGFGASASGAIGCAMALNEFLELNLSQEELYNLAHKAEVVNGSGLGDVIGLLQGGWEYRTKAGSPSLGEAKNILENSYKVATLSLGPIETKSVIRSDKWKEQINKVGRLFMSGFYENPSIRSFATISRQFSVTSYLATPDIMKIMQETENEEVLVCQIMLGNGVFIVYKNSSEISNFDNYIEEEICYNTVKKYG